MKYLYIHKSSNAKTGPIPQTYSQPETCPPSCMHYKSTCYAEGFHTSLSWRRAKDGIDLQTLCTNVAALPDGQLWRHNVAGDLPGIGEDVDLGALRALTAANKGRRGFTFTHKHSAEALAAAAEATAGGLIVNVSADGLQMLDSLHQRGAWPLVVVLPSTAAEKLTSPGGVDVVVCPAQTREDATCETCGLCTRAGRPKAIGFLSHGFRGKKLNVKLEAL